MGAIFIAALIIIIIVIILYFDKKGRNQKNSHAEEIFKNLEIKTQELRQQNIEWGRLHAPIGKFNNEGILFEKDKKPKEAIKAYENSVEYIIQNIDKFDRIPSCHPFDRLMILYRKYETKDQEIEFITSSIDKLKKNIDSDSLIKWQERLNKLKINKLK